MRCHKSSNHEQINTMSHYPVQKFLPNSMKRSSSVLLILSLFAGQLHAGGGGGNDQGYYTEEPIYQSRPNPERREVFRRHRHHRPQADGSIRA